MLLPCPPVCTSDASHIIDRGYDRMITLGEPRRRDLPDNDGVDGSPLALNRVAFISVCGVENRDWNTVTRRACAVSLRMEEGASAAAAALPRVRQQEARH